MQHLNILAAVAIGFLFLITIADILSYNAFFSNITPFRSTTLTTNNVDIYSDNIKENRSLLTYNKMKSKVSGGGPFRNIENVLFFSSPVTTVPGNAELSENGYLTGVQANNIETFSMDVGANVGLVMYKKWLQQLPYLYVVGIEANKQLVDGMNNNPEFASQRSRSLLIRAAASSRRGVARFNPGVGYPKDFQRSDQGSLFGWLDPSREKTRIADKNSQLVVRRVRLDDILPFIPPPNPEKNFMWDTLKIDVQGADADALLSAGDYLTNFMCVVGEFQTYNYEIPTGFIVDPAPQLRAAGFIYVNPDKSLSADQIWINPKWKEVYKKNPEKYSCHRVEGIDTKLILKALGA